MLGLPTPRTQVPRKQKRKGNDGDVDSNASTGNILGFQRQVKDKKDK